MHRCHGLYNVSYNAVLHFRRPLPNSCVDVFVPKGNAISIVSRDRSSRLPYKFQLYSEKWIPITIMALRRSTRLLAAASLEHSIHVSTRSLIDESQFEFVEGNAPKRTRKRKLSSNQEPSDGDGEEYSMGASSKPPPMKRRGKVEPVAYVIPDVQKKETTFKGRLGTTSPRRTRMSF